MSKVTWKVWVEVQRPDGTSQRHEIGAIERSMSPGPDDLGIRLAEAKELLSQLQMHVVQDQVEHATALDRTCPGCGSRRSLHDHRPRAIDTLFGRIAVREPRWRSCCCRGSGRDVGSSNRGGRLDRVSELLSARATPELVRVQAELGARLSFREAARVMSLLLPSNKSSNHTSVRRRLARTADRLQARDDASPHRMSLARGSPMVISIDGAHIRAYQGFRPGTLR
jgi:hypothetical protein